MIVLHQECISNTAPWAVENGYEDYNIKIEWDDEYSYGWSEVSKVGLIVTEPDKTITINI